MPIISKLDPAITTVISGHTHWAYICRGTPPEIGPQRLLTSAGKYGYFVTDLRLEFDPATHRLMGQDARNIVVGNGERGTDAAEQAMVDRYAAAVAPIAHRVIGRLTEPAPNALDDSESAAADMIADSMLAAMRSAENGGAQLALVNATGVRVSLPAGDIKYEQAFSMMPFGNRCSPHADPDERSKIENQQTNGRQGHATECQTIVLHRKPIGKVNDRSHEEHIHECES